MKKVEVNSGYCIMCGNHLDPKIHVDFGKTNKELAKIQNKLLISVIKEYYYRYSPTLPENKVEYFTSIIDELLNKEET